jgi:predicted AAA+ superfamily ATPase
LDQKLKKHSDDSNANDLFKSKALQKMLSWKESPRRSALCVTGARQIGKTTLIRHFAHEHHETVVEINFVTDPKARVIFSESLAAVSVITALPTIDLTALQHVPAL